MIVVWEIDISLFLKILRQDQSNALQFLFSMIRINAAWILFNFFLLSDIYPDSAFEPLIARRPFISNNLFFFFDSLHKKMINSMSNGSSWIWLMSKCQFSGKSNKKEPFLEWFTVAAMDNRTNCGHCFILEFYISQIFASNCQRWLCKQLWLLWFTLQKPS